jgi:hypothetical protein
MNSIHESVIASRNRNWYRQVCGFGQSIKDLFNALHVKIKQYTTNKLNSNSNENALDGYHQGN